MKNLHVLQKEEPKQEYEYIGECKGNDDGCFMDSCGHNCGCFVRKPKQETLEEAAENYSEGWGKNNDEKSFIAGAKWQAQRMYSEEEVLDLLQKRDNYLMTPTTQSLLDFLMPEEWFEQFKKK